MGIMENKMETTIQGLKFVIYGPPGQSGLPKLASQNSSGQNRTAIQQPRMVGV